MLSARGVRGSALAGLSAITVAALAWGTPALGTSPGSPVALATGMQSGMQTGMSTAPTAPASPQEWRARFEQLLGQHSILTIRLMRTVVSPKPDFREAASAALQTNTTALSALVATAYGKSAGAAFQTSWQSHITQLFSYAASVAGNDKAGQQNARASLSKYAVSYGQLVSGASHGKIPASAAADSVRMHVSELMQQIDAYAKKDYATAFRIERMAYEHMFTAGLSLAKGAALPAEVAVGIDSPPQQLRSKFTMLLGEHMELAVDATRAAFSSKPEFTGAAAQLDANSQALAAAIGTLAGASSADQFSRLWADHVNGFVAYVTATANKDAAGQQQARARLATFATQMAELLNKVVKGKLPVSALANALTVHDTALLQHADAYGAGNYAKANDVDLMGYDHMIETAEALVNALQGTLSAALPRGGAKTGGGGTAPR